MVKQEVEKSKNDIFNETERVSTKWMMSLHSFSMIFIYLISHS